MSYIPTPEQAMELVRQYNSEPFHLSHAETVGHVMAKFAEEADPENTTKIHMSMDCRAEGIEEHFPGQPAVPLMVQETVDGDKYHFTMRHGGTLRRETASTFEFVSGYFPTIMPYGEIHIHVGEMLEPTPVPSQPNDQADRAKILSKYFK